METYPEVKVTYPEIMAQPMKQVSCIDDDILSQDVHTFPEARELDGQG